MSDAARLRDAVVLVVGDVMLDEYLWGDVERISPEAPVPVVRVSHRTVAPGGAANAAAGIAALGGRARLAGVVGDDVGGTQLIAALREARVEHGGVLVDPGRITTTKSRLVARGQHVVRTDSEDRCALPAEVEDGVLAFVGDHVAGADAVVVSDYAKGVLSPPLTRAVIELANRHGRPVIADPAGTDYRKYRGATVITPNVEEVEAAVRIRVRDEQDLVKAGQELAALLAGTEVLITRGADGMWLMSGDGVLVDIPARARSVYDVTGAGDTVVAALAVAMGSGMTTGVAVRLANAAAGIAVGKVGTARVTRDELNGELVGELGGLVGEGWGAA